MTDFACPFTRGHCERPECQGRDARCAASHLAAVATKMRDEYAKEFRSARAAVEEWPGWIDGFDSASALDAAYLELDGTLKWCHSESKEL